MKTVIAVASKYGTGEKVAAEIGRRISRAAGRPGEVGAAHTNASECTIYNTIREKVPATVLADADRIILGPSVYAGQMPGKFRDWVDRNLEVLLAKPLALFVCCMSSGEQALAYLGANLPADLVAHAQPKAALGGAFNLERMGMFDRFLIRTVAKVRASAEHIDWKAIEEFSDLLAAQGT